MQSQVLSHKQPAQWTQLISLWQFLACQAKANKGAATAQRVLRDHAQAEKVIKEAQA
jgi:hypothetical protein